MRIQITPMVAAIGHAALALALALATGGSAQAEGDGNEVGGPHPAVGAWQGVGAKGQVVEIVVREARPNGRVTGTRCYRTANHLMRANTLEGSKARADGNTIRWRERPWGFTLRAIRGRAQLEERTKGKKTSITRLSAMRTTQCSDRFRFDAAVPPTEPEQESEEHPLLGSWEGTWAGKRNRIGLSIESVEGGQAIGRYCIRTIEGEAGREGEIVLWDIHPEAFPGEVNNKGQLTMMNRLSERVVERVTITPDYGRLGVNVRTESGSREGRGGLHRNHHERGCTHRTTPRPSARTRPWREATD